MGTPKHAPPPVLVSTTVHCGVMVLQSLCRYLMIIFSYWVAIHVFVNVLVSLCVAMLSLCTKRTVGSSEGHLFTASTLSIGPQVIFTVFILLWLWLIPVPVPIFILQLLFQPLFQTQLVLRKPVQVCPSLLNS